MSKQKRFGKKNYKSSKGTVHKNKARKRIARRKYFRNCKEGVNPDTGKEFYLLQPQSTGVFSLLSTWQTRKGAEVAKDGRYGLIIYEKQRVNELMDKVHSNFIFKN